MRVWKMIGKHNGPLGTTIIYGAEGCAYEIQSRKRHIPHANGSGTWDHTTYCVLQEGQDLKEFQRLQAAKDYVDRLEAGTCPEPIPEIEDCTSDCFACWNREKPEKGPDPSTRPDGLAQDDRERGAKGCGMTAEREAAILEAALAKWGEAAQAIKAIEELSELQTQLARWACGELVGDLMPRRKDPEALERSVREEIADCYIMLEQMELAFGDVAEIEEEKLLRLEEDTKDAAE